MSKKTNPVKEMERVIETFSTSGQSLFAVYSDGDGVHVSVTGKSSEIGYGLYRVLRDVLMGNNQEEGGREILEAFLSAIGVILEHNDKASRTLSDFICTNLEKKCQSMVDKMDENKRADILINNIVKAASDLGFDCSVMKCTARSNEKKSQQQKGHRVRREKKNKD